MSLIYLLVLLAPISLLLTLLAQAAVLLVLSKGKPANAPAPPITILKPVKGADAQLYKNLASFAEQDYPCFEIRIGAEDPLDPALEIARAVQADHPGVRISVHAGARELGLNPKVNLLEMLSAHAEHAHLLISDSNVRVGPTYLRDTAAELADPQVGLVTNLLVGTGEGLGALLENLHLGSFVASATSLARVASGRACVIGKSMLFRKRDLDGLGGFRAVRNVLAEDYLIGRSFELAGYKVALSPYLVQAVNDGWTVERFVNRHLRWAMMRRRLSPAAYAGEILLNPVVWISLAALALWVTRTGPDLRLLAAAAAGIAVKCASDAALLRRLLGRLPRAREVLAIPFKDLLVGALWLVGAFRRTVDWRGHVMTIEAGSRLSLPERGAEPLAQEAA
jgi:ceramide glucosyltransferase